MKTIILLTFISFTSFGQRTFRIDKNETDSINLKHYKIFLVSEDVVINFIGRQIPKSKRFRLTKEEAVTADNLFQEQYINANVAQYYKQAHDPELYGDSTELAHAGLIYKHTYKEIEKTAKRNKKQKIKNYNRYFYGYLNTNGEKLVLMRFDPRRVEYTSLPGTGESHIDVLTIYVLNLDRKELSMSGWADFDEN